MEEITLDLYNNLNTRDKEQFKKVSNKLLSNCFICGKIESNRNDYYFKVQESIKFSMAES